MSSVSEIMLNVWDATNKFLGMGIKSVTAAAAGSGSTYVFTRPVGTLDTDYVIIGTYRENQVDPTLPSGFTSIAVQNYNTTPAIQVRVIGGLAGSAGSWTVTWAGAAWRNGWGMVIRGFDSSTPIEVVGAWLTDVTNGTAITAPGITTLTPYAVVLGCYFVRSGGVTWAPPSGFTEYLEEAHAYPTTKEFASAGATGDQIATVNLSGVRAALLLSIKPASGGGGLAHKVASRRRKRLVPIMQRIRAMRS